jgi:hypothetical protein
LGAWVSTGSTGADVSAMAGSIKPAWPSNASLQRPQRTMPPRNFNWSEATRKIVLQ